MLVTNITNTNLMSNLFRTTGKSVNSILSDFRSIQLRDGVDPAEFRFQLRRAGGKAAVLACRDDGVCLSAS